MHSTQLVEMVQWPLFCVIVLYLVAYGVHCIKVVEDVVVQEGHIRYLIF